MTMQIIDQLLEKGFILRYSDNKLSCISLSGEKVDAELAAIIKENRGDLIEYLKKQAIPLSSSQQRLYFLHEYSDDLKKSYNITTAFNIKGCLDVSLLEKSFNAVIESHDIYRTFFKIEKGVPKQIIQDKFRISLSPEIIEKDRLKDVINEESSRSFDLSELPLFRVRLLSISDNNFVLILTQHHIISDAWSMRIIEEDLSNFYNSRLVKVKNKMHQISLQYSDYSLWQNKYLQGKELLKQKRYWVEKLRDYSPLHLMTDYPRLAHKTYNGDSYKFELNSTIIGRLNFIMSQSKATMFMILLSVYKLLLYKYTGNNDLIIGTPIANRNHNAFERVAGFFVNTLPIRTILNKSLTFLDLLNEAKKSCLDAYDNQDLPFDEILKELQLERDPSLDPVFQVMFTLQNSENTKTFHFEGLDIEEIDFDYKVSKFDLTFNFIENKGKITGCINYNSDLFCEETIRKMSLRFVSLLQDVVDNPNKQLVSYAILSSLEKQQLLETWNTTKKSYPHQSTINKQFEEQVKNKPNNFAVVFKDQHLTYLELNEKANQLAHYLHKNIDIGPDTVLGLCFERSLDMIVGILGILKSGAAYLPIDPKYPQIRKEFMLSDAKIGAIVTHNGLVDHYEQVEIIDFTLNDEIWRCSVENQDYFIRPTDLAYVIYTSGSTGKPKGVMVEHHSVLNLVAFEREILMLNSSSRVLSYASLCFDASVWEIFSTLLSGACLHVVDDDVRNDVNMLCNYIDNSHITNALLPPVILQELPKKELPSLRVLVVAGDTTSYKTMEYWSKNRTFINAYGPTESTVCTSLKLWKEDDSALNIGKPIANTTVYVLDRNHQLVPPGVPGELCIGGVGLARGYLNRPELTKERFIRNQFLPKERLYRSGDLVRWSPNGDLEYIGRIDNQVKVRGVRVELGEIEAALLQHQDITHAIVILKNQYLIAYYVAKEPITDLRQYLKKQLPHHMIPNYTVRLDHMPLTVNGKIDKNILPEPVENNCPSSEQYAAPKTEIEILLHNIWCEVLRLEKIGLRDNFFSLGGDSIMSIQVVARARSAGLKLTPKQLFSNPTIAELSMVATIEKPKAESKEISLKGTFDFTPIQQWFFEQKFKNVDYFNQSCIFKITENITISELKSIVNKIIEHHDVFRLRFKGDQQFYSTINHESENIVQSFNITAATDIQTICNKIQKSLNTDNGPTLRFILFNGHPDGYKRLFIVAHHLVIDGVSWRILLEDFVSLYKQIKIKSPVLVLEHKTSSYQSWYNTLLTYKDSKALQEHWNYWSNVGKKTNQPLIKKREAVVSVQKSYAISLTTEETESLLNKVPEAYKTQINDILLTALALAYKEWADKDEILLHLEGHGREDIVSDIDISRTVGWFTSLFPVHLKLQTNRNHQNYLANNLKSIKEQLRCIPDKGLSYGVLRYLSDDKRAEELVKNDTAYISFNYLGQLDGMQGELLVRSNEDKSLSIDPENMLPDHININGSIVEKRFAASFDYNTGFFNRKEIEKFADKFIEYLRAVIDHCSKLETQEYTPSDFPLSNLSQIEVDKLTYGNNITQIYGLSPLQEGLLFHALYAPQTDQYCIQLKFEYEDINREFLKKSWQILVNHYEILRTSFEWEGLNKPVQLVHKRVEIPWVEEDWRHLDSETQKEKIVEFMDTDRKSGFNLRKPCLMRMSLIRQTDNKYSLLWSHHHLLLDGWSLPILMRDLNSCYKQLEMGKSPQLSSTYPYAKYIEWIQGSAQDDAKEYWHNNLKGIDVPTELGIGGKQLDIHKNITKLGQVDISCSKEATRIYEEFVRNNKITLNTLLQMAWGVVLSKYSQSEDILLGATVSGRTGDINRIEEIVGLLINVVPIRIKFSHEKTVKEQLQELHETIQMANHYSYLTLNEVQKQSDIGLDKPLFYSLLVFENYPLDNEESAAMKICDIEAYEKTNYPLTITAIPGDRLQIRISYDAEFFHDENIKRLLNHICNALTWLTRNPNEALIKSEIMSVEERRYLVDKINDTAAEYPRDKVFSEIFEKQVIDTPNKVAIRCGDKELTYNELNMKANRLAHLLKSKGVGVEGHVALFLDRNEEYLIALLGVLKAGGCFIPLLPSHPVKKHLAVLEQLNIESVITIRNDFSKVSKICNSEKIVVLEDVVDNVELSNENTKNVSTPGNLAYIIFTSGSTGEPKGAMVEHRGMLNHLYAKVNDLALGSSDNVGQLASQIFDISIWQYMAILLTGGKVTVYSDELVWNPYKLLPLLFSDDVTILECVPSHIKSILDVIEEKEWDKKLKKLRWLLLTGEALPTSYCKRWFTHYSIPIINAYGPTECSDDVTHFVLKETPPEHWKYVPINGLIMNTKAYVVDKNMQLVPVGVIGELCIAGDGVGRGYLNKPEATRNSFLSNPFSRKENYKKLYKTGDLVRWTIAGELEFIGRNDFQVKIRGFRIEIGEIELRISKYEGIGQCFVSTFNHNNVKQLVAYFVDKKKKVSVPRLKKYLQKYLPDYMVPAFFVRLDEFPLTANGKVDIKNLPIPNSQLQMQKYEQPEEYAEKIVADIWKEVLNIDQVGMNSNFFDLGGHSLNAVQVISRIHKKLATDCPIKNLFDHPVLRTFVENLNLSSEMSAQKISNIGKADRNKKIPLSFAQQRMWFLNYYQTQYANAYNVPLIVRLSNDLDIDIFKHAVDLVVSKHESLRTVFKQDDNGLVYQEILPKVCMFDGLIESISEEELKSKLKMEFSRCFDLSAEQSIRVKIYTIGAKKDYIVLVNQHHIITDGWSQGILVRDLQYFYNKLIQNYNPKTKTLSLQYADYAAWQRKSFSSNYLHNQAQYWKKKLAGAQKLELMTDLPRPSIQTNAGSSISFKIKRNTVNQLRKLTQTHNCTMFMVLLAAYYVLLSKYSGQNDIVVGTPVANRQHESLEKVIGCFVNTLPLRADLKGHSINSFLQYLKTVCLEAFENQEMPFEKIVDSLDLPRDQTTTPLFQTMLVLQNAVDNFELNLKGVENISFLDISPEHSKFDLSLFVTEENDELECSFVFNRDIFYPETIERMGSNYIVVLQKFIANAADKLDSINILANNERNKIIDYSHGQTLVSNNDTVLDMFEYHANKNPEKIAVIYEGSSITYKELNARANKLASYLLINYNPKTVGLCAAKSIDLIMCVIAILKLGAAYVPIDTKNPGSRIQYTLNDACDCLLTTTDKVNELSKSPGTANCSIINLDIEEFADAPDGEIKIKPSKKSLAYIIYTSGSTGQPKGVMVNHGNLSNYVKSINNVVGLEECENLAVLSSIATDLGNTIIYGALCNGKTLHLVNIDIISNSRLFADYIDKNHIDCYKCTPSLLSSLIDSRFANTLLPRKTLILGGEQLSWQLVNEVRKMRPDCKIFNHYGPTETTIGSTVYKVNGSCAQGSVPIGKPINNVSTYILDDSQQLVPIGVTGELYIGGAGVSEGYLNADNITTRNFVKNPFLQKENIFKNQHQILYRTGDIVKWLDNGNIEYIARVDDQVKIRGFRVELTEIQSVLRQHPQISQCTLQIVNDSAKNELIAYYVANKKIPELELRKFLANDLPEYMIPHFFISLDEIPLMINGKVDKKKLLKVYKQKNENSQNKSPTNSIEKALTNIWCELLGVDNIAIDSDFFMSGGNSLLTIRLINRIGELFKIDIPIAWAFQNNTIEKQAHSIILDQNFGYTPVIKLNNNDAEKKLFLIHPANGGIESYFELAKFVDDSISLYGVESYNLYTSGAMIDSLEAISAKYVEEIKKISPNGPYYLGGWSMGGVIAYEIAQQLQNSGDIVKGVYLIDSEARSAKDAEGYKKVMHIVDEMYLDYRKEIPLGRIKKMELLRQVEIEMINKYRPSQYDGRVILFKATYHDKLTVVRNHKDKVIFDEYMEHTKLKKSNGWRKLVKDLHEIKVNATHYSILDSVSSNFIAGKINNDI